MFIYSITAIWQFIKDFSHWIPLFSTSSNQYSEYLCHKYVTQLREGILETYTVVVTAFKNTEKEEWIAHEFCSKRGMQQEMKALQWAREMVKRVPHTLAMLVSGAATSHLIPHLLAEIYMKQAAFSSLNIYLLMPGAQPRFLSLLKNALKPPKWSCPHPHPRRHAGPKSIINHSNNHPELSICPPPKPHLLAQSKCSGPMTSSTEEEIFEATPTPVTGEHATTASENPHAISQSQTNNLNGRNVNDQGTSATCTESHDAGYSNKDHGKDTSGTSTESCYPEEGGNDDGHKTSATSTNGRLCRSGGVKSYASDCSAGEKSSPSDSDWAVDKEQQKKAQQTTDQNIAVNHGEDDEASSKADPPSPP
ncbi:hypothetical protein EV424DRAFT_1347026 [Suillus variegatus]|nr:hypothetical protein EV424DRAFT_1347026 [Suillus variegatus]